MIERRGRIKLVVAGTKFWQGLLSEETHLAYFQLIRPRTTGIDNLRGDRTKL